MKAFILAAGLGTRLKDLTKDLPKPLLKVKGKSLIEWNILKLKSAGFDQIIINTHYLADQIEDHIGDGTKFDLKIKYSREEKILGTGGALIKAKELIVNVSKLIGNWDKETEDWYNYSQKNFNSWYFTRSSRYYLNSLFNNGIYTTQIRVNKTVPWVVIR